MDINNLWSDYDLNSKKQNSRCLAVNTILEGKYLVGPVLGQGGFGITYKVNATFKIGNIEQRISFAMKEHFLSDYCERDHVSNSVKFSTPVKDKVDESLRDFTAEALRLNTLDHPNIVAVNEVFETNDTAYYVMEYIEGKSLVHILETNHNEGKEEIYYQIGETVASINQIQIDANHPYVKDGYSWENHYAYKLLQPQLLRIVKNQFLTDDEAEKLCSMVSGLKPDITHSFLHRDIRPANIIYRDGRLFVIDAETCEFGDPLNDLARINLEWHYWEMYDILLDGYKSVMSIDTDNELFYFYQLESLAEILDMHFNYGCANSTTPFFENKFKEIKSMLLY